MSAGRAVTLSRLWPGRDAGSGGGGGGDPRAAAESRGIRRRQRRCHETLTPRGQSGMRAVGCGRRGGHRRVPGRDALVNSTAPGSPRPRSDGWGREAQTSPRSAGGARCSRPSGAEGGSAPLEPPSPPPLRAVTCRSRGLRVPCPSPIAAGCGELRRFTPRRAVRGAAASLVPPRCPPSPPTFPRVGLAPFRRSAGGSRRLGEGGGSAAARCAAPGPAAGLCKRRPRGAAASCAPATGVGGTR